MVRLVHLMPLALKVCLSDRAFWRKVPLPVWGYELGGYRVLEKWLSCWDWEVLGRVPWVKQVPLLGGDGAA